MSETPPMAEVPVVKGGTVLIHGVHDGLAGEECIVEGFDPRSGRWRVRLESGELHDLRPENLTGLSLEPDPKIEAKLEVQVPSAAPPGSRLQCQGPGGEAIIVTVPQGARPGSVIGIRRNSRAGSWEVDAAVTPKEAEPPPHRVGDVVEGLFADGRWHQAQVAEVLSGGTFFKLNWADGDPQDRVKPPEHVRGLFAVGEVVEGQKEGLFCEGRWYRATITRVEGNGAYSVRWEDNSPLDLLKRANELRKLRGDGSPTRRSVADAAIGREHEEALKRFRYGDGLYEFEEMGPKVVTASVGEACAMALKMPGCVAFWRSPGRGDTWFASARYDYEFPNGSMGMEWYDRIS